MTDTASTFVLYRHFKGSGLEYRSLLRDGRGRTVARSSAGYRAKADYAQIPSGQW